MVVIPLTCGSCRRSMDLHKSAEDPSVVARWCPFCGQRSLTWRFDKVYQCTTVEEQSKDTHVNANS